MVKVFADAIEDIENEFTIDDVPDKWKQAVVEELERRKATKE